MPPSLSGTLSRSKGLAFRERGPVVGRGDPVSRPVFPGYVSRYVMFREPLGEVTVGNGHLRLESYMRKTHGSTVVKNNP